MQSRKVLQIPLKYAHRQKLPADGKNKRLSLEVILFIFQVPVSSANVYEEYAWLADVRAKFRPTIRVYACLLKYLNKCGKSICVLTFPLYQACTFISCLPFCDIHKL